MGDLGTGRGDDGYTDGLYHLEVTSDHVRSHSAIIVCRPWLRRSTSTRSSRCRPATRFCRFPTCS